LKKIIEIETGILNSNLINKNTLLENKNKNNYKNQTDKKGHQIITKIKLIVENFKNKFY